MKPYRRAHDTDDPELRDYFVWNEERRPRWPARLFVGLLALIVFALAFTALAFAQDGYHKIALKDLATTKWSHACVVGNVAFKAKQRDGDLHIRLTDTEGHFIVAEVIPRLPLIAPKTSAHVEVCGITRIDRFHGWPEIHPTLRIRLLPKGTS